MMIVNSPKTKVIQGIGNLFVILCTLIVAAPLYITAINIFKPTDLISESPMSLPNPPILDNIISVLKNPNVSIGKMYFNSICITLFGTLICVVISSLA